MTGEPRERDKGVHWAQPPGPPLPTWGPYPARPTLGSQLPRFSRRREERAGERQGCACLLLPPLPSAGPFPSRQETSPDSQPAAALPPRPTTSNPAHGVTLPSAAGGPCDSAPAPLAPLLWPLRPSLSQGRPQPTGPSSWSPGLASPSPTLVTRWVAREEPDKAPLPQVHWLLSQRRPGTPGRGCERAFVLGRLGGKGRSQAWNLGPEGEGGGRKAPSLNPLQVLQGRRGDLGDSLFAVATALGPNSGPQRSAAPKPLWGVTGRAQTR